MTSDLYRLVYYSRNRIRGSQDEVADAVEAILAAARRNNARVGVTGALIFNAGVFAQVLEGARRDIEATFEAVQRDERHGDVQVLVFEPVESRSFPSWSMAFVGQSRAGQDLFGHIAASTDFEAKRMEGERILQLVQTIALDEEPRAD